MENEILNKINEKLQTELTPNECRSNTQALTILLEMMKNGECDVSKHLREIYYFKQATWSDENIEILISLLKEKGIKLNAYWEIKANYKILKRCLEEKIELDSFFLQNFQEDLIDDYILDLIIENKVKLPTRFLENPQNVERLLKYDPKYIFETYILSVSEQGLNDANTDKVIEILKENPDFVKAGYNGRIITRNAAFMKKCLESDLDIDYSFFVNDALEDEEVLKKIIEKKARISLNGTFFKKQENIAKALNVGAIRWMKHFNESLWTEDNLKMLSDYISKNGIVKPESDRFSMFRRPMLDGKIAETPQILKSCITSGSFTVLSDFGESVWTEENIQELVQAIKTRGVPDEERIRGFFYYPLFPEKLRENQQVLKACIESNSITVLRDFNENIWSEEIINELCNQLAKFQKENTEKDWKYLPDFLRKNPEVLKTAIFVGNENAAKGQWFFRNEAWTDENKQLYKESLNNRKEAYKKFEEQYSIDIKLSDEQIFTMFDEEGIKKKGLQYLFEQGYANILNRMLDENKIEKTTFSDRQIKILDYCRNLNQEGDIAKEFTKMFCKYVANRDELNDEQITSVLEKVKKAIFSCQDLDIKNLKDSKILQIYIKYIENNMENMKNENFELSFGVIKRIEYSNSSELAAFTEQIANGVLETEKPLETLEEIENIFLKNELPTVGKTWEVFMRLHPELAGFNFSQSSKVSPVLANAKSVMYKKAIIFADLIRVNIGSNNKSFNEYLNRIERGSQLVEKVIEEDKMLETNTKEYQELMSFIQTLITLYQTSFKSKIQKSDIEKDDDIIVKIKKLKDMFTIRLAKEPIELADSIVKMYCHYAGFDSLKEIREYQQAKLKQREERHIEISKKPITLKKGDYIKGIRDLRYLATILENGAVSKEFLGDAATSDRTPLDTDCSLILEEKENIEETIRNTIANSFGPIWFVLKGDDRFNITRDTSNNIVTTSNPKDKMEMFSTLGNGHCGIRTGFASSEIDYIVATEHYDRIALELAIKGMYIPVTDKKGTLKFSYEQYLELRDKMQGLSYFDMSTYQFSKELNFEGITQIENSLEKNHEEVDKKRSALCRIFEEALPEYEVATTISKDITPGRIEILDTGSTGRGTNVIGDGDFDFIVRVDKEILLDPKKAEELKSKLAQALGEKSTSDKFRFEGVSLEGLEEKVDVDMTFITRTNKMEYATEMCVRDRLETIKRQDPVKYKKVVANIIYAKTFMKEHECYKPWHAGKNPQGGLGGVGIENWILQNGGSFIEACKSFTKAAKGKTLEEFKKEYMIWDFGSNHMAKNGYPHDNFVYNMHGIGYEKMTTAIEQFLEKQREGQDPRE